jgi:hypothetical protein
MYAIWRESALWNPYVRLGDRTITVFRRRGTDQWGLCCHAGGSDGKIVYHPRRFPCKADAIEKACQLFGIATRPEPEPEVDDLLSLKQLRDRVLGRS